MPEIPFPENKNPERHLFENQKPEVYLPES